MSQIFKYRHAYQYVILEVFVNCPVAMFHSNNTSNASSDVQELGPFDTVYTVVELSSGGCLAMVIITYLLTK